MRNACSISALLLVLFAVLGGVETGRAQQTQSLFQQSDPAVGVIGGYLSGGEVESGFGGVLMTLGSRYDVGFVYSAAPDVRAYGGQIGGRLSTPGESVVTDRQALGAL